MCFKGETLRSGKPSKELITAMVWSNIYSSENLSLQVIVNLTISALQVYKNDASLICFQLKDIDDFDHLYEWVT